VEGEGGVEVDRERRFHERHNQKTHYRALTQSISQVHKLKLKNQKNQLMRRKKKL
jgi:hypothetical protein